MRTTVTYLPSTCSKRNLYITFTIVTTTTEKKTLRFVYNEKYPYTNNSKELHALVNQIKHKLIHTLTQGLHVHKHKTQARTGKATRLVQDTSQHYVKGTTEIIIHINLSKLILFIHSHEYQTLLIHFIYL